jgi:hypothetical protein
MKVLKMLGFPAMLGGILLLLANGSGVPQAVTKAPGEVSHNSCATCHTPVGNYVPTIGLEVLGQDLVKTDNYVPGQSYTVRVKVAGTNNPKSYGFQMACLDSLTNSDRGIWSDLGANVKQQNLTVQQKQRKYLVQSSPKSDGIFTAKWKAPDTNVGPIKFYFAGLAVNLTGNTNGDNNVIGQFTLKSPASSSQDNIAISTEPTLFPNPSNGSVSINSPEVAYVIFHSLLGTTDIIQIQNHELSLETLKIGTYIVKFYDKNQRNLGSQKFIKF